LGVTKETTPNPYNLTTDKYSEIVFCLNAMKSRSIFRLSLGRDEKLTTPEEALALNDIIIMSLGIGLIYGFEQEKWENIVFPNSVKKYILDDVDICIKQDDERDLLCIIQNYAKAWKFAPSQVSSAFSTIVSLASSPLLQKTNAVLSILVYKIKDGNWNAQKMTENQLSMNMFDPIASSFMSNIERTQYFGCDHEIIESIERKKLATILGENPNFVTERKPDRSIQVEVDNRKYHVFLAEINCEKTAIGRPDLVKLGTMMKDCIDHILDVGYNRKECYVLGMLQEGVMDLPSNYLYHMKELYSCSLPYDNTVMILLPDAITLFHYASLLTEKMTKILKDGDQEDNDDLYDFRLTSKSPKRHCEYYM
jgi:hypothetical protein